MSKKDKSTFGHFFKEDEKAVQEIFNGQTDQQSNVTVGAVKKEEFPKVSSADKANEDEFNAFWLRLRSFFRTAHNPQGLTDDLSPVIMAPLYTQTTVGSDFPVWVSGSQNVYKSASCLSLNEMLVQAFDDIAPGEKDALILKKSLERILHLANDQFADTKPRLFLSVITQALDTLATELDVKGEEGKTFGNDLESLKNALPPDGFLLPYSINTSFQILEAASHITLARTRDQLTVEIEEIKSKLEDLLRIEENKNLDKAPEEGKKVTANFMDSIVNFDEISSMAPDSATVSLGEERLQRIKVVVKELEKGQTTLKQLGFIFIDKNLNENNSIDWSDLFENLNIEVYKKGGGVDAIHACFNKNISDWTRLYAAKRIGEFEINNNYLPEIHDDYFEHFDWTNFSTEELSTCPHFILIAEEHALFESELSQLSSLLSDNIPVKIVSVKSAQAIKDSGSLSDSNAPGLHANVGMGALMLSHKNIYVAQSTSITPKYLFNAVMDGLSAFAPAYFSILNINDNVHTHPYLWTSAAIESRDFPGFTYQGLLGTPWGSRFEVQNNPQPQALWPVHEKTIINADEEKVEMRFAFTFAHQATLSSSFHHHYMHVDSSYWDDNLIPLTVYNQNKVEENIGKIPFIWLLNAQNQLCKIAVSWPMVLATQERLDFWRFLQENSGINNFHVTQAVENAQSEMGQLHSEEIEKLKDAHKAEIEKVREEEAGNVMENLTSVLLGLDTSHVVTSHSPANRPATVSNPDLASADQASRTQVSEKDVAGDTPAEEDDSMLSNDPYIDTALCTSCNECLDLNGIMFKYNTDKMAFIADPKAGTFLDLVKAAELCPVGIIHPGSPLNPSEADLDSLVLRAEKFN